MANLYAAHEQWANRPADERFETLEDMRDVTRHHKESARSAVVPTNVLRVVPTDNQVGVAGSSGQVAKLTNWSFGQLCLRAGAPAGYLRQLPKNLVAECLNTGLAARPADDESTLLIHRNGDLVCRQFSSDQYARIWNTDLAEKLIELQSIGWQVPPARPALPNQPGARQATESDVLRLSGGGLSVKVGDIIAPAGIYASDHDMFAFMVNEKNRIDDGTDGGLGQGFFLSNSEVGAASLKITKFLYRYVCGNHIVWDAKDVKELKIVHKGNNDRRYAGQIMREMYAYSRDSMEADRARVEKAMAAKICAADQNVVEVLYARDLMPRKTLELAWEHAKQEADLRTKTDPRSVWGFVQGITSASQTLPHTDDRVAMDRAAGKLMSMAF